MEKYAREHGMLEALKICCDLDYKTAKAKHATLYREQTLADDGEMCDYWFVGDKTENPH